MAAAVEEADALAATYRAEGCVFPIRLFADDDAGLDDLDALCTQLVEGRPKNLASEDLLNLHWTVPEVLRACRRPDFLRVARTLLDTDDVSVFTSRILCKLPRTGKEIVWHQDSNYWPLVPPGHATIAPKVCSIWLALDDVTEDNGPMEVLPFSAQPESRGRSVDELVVDAGGDTSGYDNFNLSLDASKLNLRGSRKVLLTRGEAEAHSAWTIHRSAPNASDRRRMVFIVRYCPTGTAVVPGVRGSFDADFPLCCVAGAGATDAVVSPKAPRYAPCFGNAVAALKK